MFKNPWKFKSGIYPVIPGQSMELGDYGYWKDDQWCRVGNIKEIKDFPIELSEKEVSLDQFVKEQLHVIIQTAGAVEGKTEGMETGVSLKFEKKHSQFFLGNLKKCRYFCSIDQEILPYLLKLHEAGIWQKKYWLAYYVVKSDRFFTFRSKNEGVEAKLKIDLSADALKESANLSSMVSSGLDLIESVSSLGDEMKFAGAKFISLEKKYPLLGEKKIKYNYGENDDLFP